MREPVWEPRARFEDLRGERGFAAAAPGLWSLGDLRGLAGPCVAIVGTRAATAYGRRLAWAFGKALGLAGCCVVSGLALGIDAAAHEGALEAAALTVGVLGGGHERFFPRKNAGLAERMVAAGGAVLSPFPPGEPARKPYFLARNGVVAALVDAVVVIEAPERSGALNTAGWAAGRVPVLAVPGDVDRKHSAGCLALIRDGATLARDPGDVLEAMGMAREPRAVSPPSAGDPIAHELLAALRREGPRSLDALIAACGVPASLALAGLTKLELQGCVERRGPDEYALVN